MNHKRGKPKSARAGCLMCKPHKANEFKDSFQYQTIQERKAIINDKEWEENELD